MFSTECLINLIFFKGTNNRVKITVFHNPTDFYIQRMETLQTIKELETDIANYVKNDPLTPEAILISKLFVMLLKIIITMPLLVLE